MEKELYKTRSFSACIHDAYILFCNNCFKIVKRTWLPSLVLSLVVACICSIAFTQVQTISTNPITTIASVIGLIVVFIFAGSWLLARCLSLFLTAPFSSIYKKCCYTNGIISLISAIISIIAFIVYFVLVFFFVQSKINIVTAAIYSIGITVLFYIVTLLFTLPLAYSFTAYLLEEKAATGHIFKKNYKTGFKHYGYLFATVAMSYIILFICSLPLAVPSIILFLASESNAYSMLLGDSFALPSYFLYIVILAQTIFLFGNNYLSIWFFMVLRYAYGSITAYEKQLQQQKTSNLV